MSQINFRALFKGLVSYIPGARARFCSGSGGTLSARYCYSVWMRHLIKASEAGLVARLDRIAELGPGDSLGIGLSAILSGANEYIAFDAKPHASVPANSEVFEELVRLFASRTVIPDENEFPALSPVLTDYEFPHKILTQPVLDRSLAPDRINAVRRTLAGGTPGAGLKIRYLAPWQGVRLPEIENGLDMALSQAVMEHVEDVPGTYLELYRWLRPGGFMSHTIDYRSHGYTKAWNGHWALGTRIWRCVKGRRPYLINRIPHSEHITAMERAGFIIIAELKRRGNPLARRYLAADYAEMPDDDLVTSGAFVLAMKPFCQGSDR